MSRPTTYRPQTARCHRVPGAALAVCAVLAAAAPFPTSAMATEGKLPLIEGMSALAGGEVKAGARVNPEGLETTYEIWVECPSCQPNHQSVQGQLPAVYESHTVSLSLMGGPQQGGYKFEFGVRARNASGEEVRRSEFEVPPSPAPSPAPFPDGAGGIGAVEAPYLGAAMEEARPIAVHQAELQKAKEEEEQKKAKEAAAIPASEAAAPERGGEGEAEETAARGEERLPCIVPAMRGDTLPAARRALSKAHCRLGKVTWPRHHHGMSIVTRQDTRPGERFAHGARVALWVGVRQTSRTR